VTFSFFEMLASNLLFWDSFWFESVPLMAAQVNADGGTG
jgi:hypothetical protein